MVVQRLILLGPTTIGWCLTPVSDSGVVSGSTSASNTLELASAASAGLVTGLGTEILRFGSIVFDAGAEWLVAGITRALAGTISGFAVGDTIDVTGVTATGSSYVGGILTLDEMSGSVTLDLPGSFSTASFDVTDVAGGTDVSLVEQTVSWINSAGGDWATGSGWNTGTVPTPSEIAAIDTPGSYTVTTNSGEKDTAFGLSVAGGVTLSVDAGSSLDLGSPASVAGTLINAGTVSSRVATAVTFASSTDRLILDPGATFTGTVVGGGANTTLELAAGSGAGTLNALGTTFTDFGAVTVDAGATWTVEALASALAGTTITGSGGSNRLEMVSAGTFSLGGVSEFTNIYLASGNSTVTVTDTTLLGGSVALHDGASGNNSISAAGDTAASKGKTLYYVAGTGPDSFIGGFENDTVYVSATAVGGDTLTGGSGDNALILTSAGTLSLGGVSKFGNIYLAAGNSTVTVADTTLSGGAATLHDGASGTNNVSAAEDTAASKGKILYYVTGTGPDSFAGGFENDTVYVSATAVGGDTLTGGTGADVLVMTTAGTFSLGGVSRFPTIYLAAGTSTVTVTDNTLSGGLATLHDVAGSNNSISAAGDTSASKGKSLTYFPGTGTDSFTGGYENDTIYIAAGPALGGDTFTGGSGTNAVVMMSAGTVDLDGVSKFPNVFLTGGNNTVTVTDTTLSGGSVAVHDGPSGNNSVSAAGDTTASKGKTLYYFAGKGNDSFTGGFENDTVYAGSGTDTVTASSGNDTIFAGTGLGTFTAGSGSDTFVFMADNLPTQTLDNFQVNADDLVVYGVNATNGFDLGSTDNGLNPLVPEAIDPTIFIANSSGTFTSAGQRFAYDTTNGDLFYSATGSNVSESLVATLTGTPGLTAGNILFQH
jgi:trimeric autotransporter adhesin